MIDAWLRLLNLKHIASSSFSKSSATEVGWASGSMTFFVEFSSLMLLCLDGQIEHDEQRQAEILDLFWAKVASSLDARSEVGIQETRSFVVKIRWPDEPQPL